MWIFTTIGFFSVVAHPGGADALMVRARVREDLVALRRGLLPDIEIERTPDRDYRYRTVVSREDWAHAAERLAAGIDYANFKDAVAERQGHDRAQRYGRVWSVMHALQQESDTER
jgi:hypothetical protein